MEEFVSGEPIEIIEISTVVHVQLQTMISFRQNRMNQELHCEITSISTDFGRDITGVIEQRSLPFVPYRSDMQVPVSDEEDVRVIGEFTKDQEKNRIRLNLCPEFLGGDMVSLW